MTPLPKIVCPLHNAEGKRGKIDSGGGASLSAKYVIAGGLNKAGNAFMDRNIYVCNGTQYPLKNHYAFE